MEFDKHAASYHNTLDESLAGVGGNSEYFARLKADHLMDVARCLLGPTETLRCLDVGCGTGVVERFLTGRFAVQAGCDPSSRMLDEARKAVAGLALDVNVPNEPLPYADASFDVTFTP